MSRRQRHLWATVLVVVAVVAVSSLLPATWEQRIRYSGLALELLGVVIVALGLLETRRLFGRPSPSAALRALWESRPRREIRIAVGSGNLMLDGVTMRGYGTVGPPPNATLEQRITALESQMQNVNNLVHVARDEIEKRAAEQKEALEKERGERSQADTSIRKLIDDAIVGGLALEAMGLFWLLCGVVFATASDELARLFT